LSNTIDLILTTKVLHIAPNHVSEKSIIFNELNRAKIMSGNSTVGTEPATEGEDAASNQQQSRDENSAAEPVPSEPEKDSHTASIMNRTRRMNINLELQRKQEAEDVNQAAAE